jgi:oligoribonuclease
MHSNSLGPDFPLFDSLAEDTTVVVAEIYRAWTRTTPEELGLSLGWAPERTKAALEAAGKEGLLVLGKDEYWRRPVLFWTDLETTGLDENFNIVLEIGVVVTDIHLKELGAWSGVVSTEINHYMSPRVVEMHTKNGLFEEVRSPKAMKREVLVEKLLQFMRQWAEEGAVLMCGSTIDFDRRFLNKHYPEIAKFFHYRSINVSSFREVAKLWKREVYETLPTKKDNQESTHRVLDDCRESIGQLKHYREHLLNLNAP